MSLPSTISRVLQRTMSAIGTPLWLGVAHSVWRRGTEGDGTWVISGHRGRAYLDNSAALEEFARASGQSITWIANAPLDAELAERGVRTLRRNSWAARRAISRASALIYSHGEDDLDLFMILLRGRSAPRFYLNHSNNFLKAGGVLEPDWEEQWWLRRLFRGWLLTDCDHLLASSKKEKENFARSYPNLADKIVMGGGAHLDSWERALRGTPRRRIYWFPTFRDSATGAAMLRQAVRDVVTSERLSAWLEANDYEFFVGAHINSQSDIADAIRPPFHVAPRADLVRDISQSEIFISDYSGIIFDFLLSERPQILFAFDRDDYLKRRCLYVDYPELDFAFHAEDSQALIDAIVEERWRDDGLREAAARWRQETLPSRGQDFAGETLQTIDRILSSEVHSDER